MLEKTKYLFCILSIALSIGAVSNLQAQQPRLFGAAGLVLDARSTPYRAVTIDVPTGLSVSYSLHLPGSGPTGPLSVLASDVNGNMVWTASGTASLPPLPPGNIWVGNASSVAMPYAPTVPGAILVLSGSSTPTWSTVIPSNTTISASQLTSGTLQSGVTINVGPGSTINPTGGTNTANNLNGAGPGNYAGAVLIPQNALTLAIAYSGIQNGSSVQVNIIDPGLPGVAAYVTQINPGTGFMVSFSASYPTTTGKVFYTVVNP